MHVWHDPHLHDTTNYSGRRGPGPAWSPSAVTISSGRKIKVCWASNWDRSGETGASFAGAAVLTFLCYAGSDSDLPALEGTKVELEYQPVFHAFICMLAMK